MSAVKVGSWNSYVGDWNNELYVYASSCGWNSIFELEHFKARYPDDPREPTFRCATFFSIPDAVKKILARNEEDYDECDKTKDYIGDLLSAWHRYKDAGADDQAVADEAFEKMESILGDMEKIVNEYNAKEND